MTKDPVCGMMVDEASAAGHVHYRGQDYYFCSKACQREFEASPQVYIEPVPVPPPHTRTDADALYSCPIHTMVLSPRPGTCPKCGRTLEPVLPEQGSGNQS